MQRDKTISHYHTDPKIIIQSRIGRFKPGQLLYLDIDGIYKLAVAWSHQESQIAGMVWEVFDLDKISLRVEPTPVFYEHPIGPEWYNKDDDGKVILNSPLQIKLPGNFGDRLWLSDTTPGELQVNMPAGPFKTIAGYKTKDGFIFRPERLFCCANEVYEPISSSSSEIILPSSSSSSIIIIVSSSSSSSFIPLLTRCKFTYTAECSYGEWAITNVVYDGCVENCTGDIGWQGSGCIRTFSYCGVECENTMISLSGLVSTSGQPLSGTSIHILSSDPVDLNYNILTDVNGNYSTLVPAVVGMTSSYLLTPSLSGYTFAPSSTNVIYTGLSMVADFSGSFIPPITSMSTLSGVVTTSGQALNGVSLNITTISHPVSASYNTTTDVSGNYFTTIIVATSASFTIIPSLSGYTFSPSSSNMMFFGSPLVANFSGNIVSEPTLAGFNVAGSAGIDGDYYLSGQGAWTFSMFGIDPSYSSYNIYSNGSYSIFYLLDYGVWVLGDPTTYGGEEPYFGYEYGGGSDPPTGTWTGAASFIYPTITVI